MRVGVIGGTGFVGGYIVAALLDAGHEVSLLVRPGSESKVDQPDRCTIVAGDADAVAALQSLLEGCDAVIYNIGILREFPARGITYEATQYQGVENTIEAAREKGVRRFLLMSANGVKQPGTRYQETKFRAEQAVRDSGIDFTVFRPSVIFGDPHGKMEIATQLYQEMIRPPVPAVGFHTGWSPEKGQLMMSPVYVEDVASAFVRSLDNPETVGKTYEIGGPEELSWTQMLQRVAEAVGKRKIVLPMPIAFMKFGATLFDWLPFFPVTRDQLTMLAEGNTADPAVVEYLIGTPPRPFSAENLAYLVKPEAAST